MHRPIDFIYHHTTPEEFPPSVLLYRKELRDTLSIGGEYATDEHLIRLPADPKTLSAVVDTAKRFWTSRLKYVVVIGIGGSNLGTQAVYSALSPHRNKRRREYPKAIFLDTPSAELLEHSLETLLADTTDQEELAVNLISKSGNTTESVVNFEWLIARLSKKYPDIGSRVIVTTDRNSLLSKNAERLRIAQLSVPKLISGRFSVFSTAGLFPLSLLGIDVVAMRRGAEDTFKFALTKDDRPMRAANIIYRHTLQGGHMLNLFFFNRELEDLGKWCRQLYGESLGKEKDRSGRTVRAGVTPIVSIGSTDLHSMAQLYLGGPKDKYTIFLRIPEICSSLPQTLLFPDIVPEIAGKKPDEIQNAIYRGFLSAYDSMRLPYGELLLPALSPYSIGAFFAWHMLVVLYLAKLWNINAFDQPNVEDYKRVTRNILSHHFSK